MDKNDIFKKRLVLARNKRGFSQSELAERSGLKPAAISHFETGQRKPSFNNLRILSDALNVTADYLLGRTDDPEGFAESDVAFRHGYEKLSSDQREMAMDFIAMLSKKK
ncbi:helix-turn-helix domain-containing protein [Marinicella meishanensis]|uniref:helix-turn-helix domain-containing protein n=1 Tax=Marinicella meishanensis TaxID=2873263 RepID=UPI001CBCBF77|nr:helix-turn-helix transcriptional regulator [Marinicella sp. NBU2979]